MNARGYVRSGMVLTVGSVASTVCSFARNIVIARLLGVEDYGIAAIFVIAVSMIERMSYIGLDRFIVQNVDGDDERVQAVAHAFQVARGVAGAALLFLLAGPIAAAFGVPEVAPAFRWFALFPLIRGFAHLDLARLQRAMRFKALVLTDLAPQVITLAIAAPIALWIGDYRVILFVYLVQVACFVATSHMLAERRFAVAWDGALLRRMVVFGWPLLINGMLMFGILQGDRVVVGSALTITDLGWYSAAFTLLMAPTVVLTRVLQSYFLPLLSSVQDDAAMYAKRAAGAGQACLGAGAAFAAGAMICGDDLLVLMYGSKYAPAAAVVPWLAAMQGVRIFRNAQNVAAIGRADTKNPMYANIVRSVSLVLAVLAVVLGFGVEGVAASGLIGECLAAVWAQRLLKTRLGLSWAPIRAGVGVSLIGLTLVGVGLVVFDRQRPMLIADFGVGVLVSGCIGLGVLGVSRELKDMLRRNLPALGVMGGGRGLGEAGVSTNEV